MTTHFSTDADHHLVRLTFWQGLGEREDRWLSADEALRLAEELVRCGRNALTQIARDYAAGNCDTCENTRMIHAPVGKTGRTELVHCPDCWSAYAAAPDDPPTIPGPHFADREADVLRGGT